MPSEPPQLMFVTGLARSGTTALMRVLAAHPEIVLGVERYKFLWRRQVPEMTGAYFERERFFSFGDGATNLTPASAARWERHYAAMAAKWETATYVGDKMTRVRMMAMWDVFPTAKFVCIVRDAAGVAASWEARAADPADGWREGGGARSSVEPWNRNLGRIRRSARLHPDQVLVVEHAGFFGDASASSLRRVLGWLDLPGSAESTAAFATAHRHHATMVDRRNDLSAEDAAYVDEHHDRVLWRDIVALADKSPSVRPTTTARTHRGQMTDEETHP